MGCDFFFYFNNGRQTVLDEIGLHFLDLRASYLEICATIPGMAQEVLSERKDPLAASFVIADHEGRTLMTVPFTDVLSPSEWRFPP